MASATQETRDYFNKATYYEEQAIEAYQRKESAIGDQWFTAARLAFHAVSEIEKSALPDWSNLPTSEFINRVKQEHNVDLKEYASPTFIGLIRPLARQAALSFSAKILKEELAPAYRALKEAQEIEGNLLKS